MKNKLENLKKDGTSYLKAYVHNAIVHPLMMFLPKDLANMLHDSNADWAFGKNRYDELKIEQELSNSSKNSNISEDD